METPRRPDIERGFRDLLRGPRPQSGLLVGAPDPVHLVGAVGEPAFNTGWGNQGGGIEVAGFYKDALGRIHLEGRVTRASGVATTIFILPVGYRPSVDRRIATDAGGAIARIVITTAGNVQLDVGGAASVGLSGVSFRAA